MIGRFIGVFALAGCGLFAQEQAAPPTPDAAAPAKPAASTEAATPAKPVAPPPVETA
jgi:hypothetical protein